MTKIIRGLGLALLAAMPLLAQAQQTPTSVWPAQGQLVKEATAMYELSDYPNAIAKYQAVTPGDTTYAQAQSGLALALSAAGRHPEAVAAARRSLALQPFEPTAYSSLAIAQDASQQPDSALATYRRALRLFPYNQELYYKQAQTLALQNRLDEALASAQRSAELRPTHPGTHQLLGTLAARQGQTAHALLSLLAYLALENDAAKGNEGLRQAERIAQNGPSLETGDQLTPVAPNTAFAELDQLLNSKVALQKKYIGKVKFNAALVRQTQLLVEKFPENGPADDFWVRAYGSLIKELRQADNLTTFTYLILRYADDQQAVLWVRDNLNSSKKVLLATLLELVKLRNKQVAGSAPSKYVMAWFNNDNELIGLGEGVQSGDKFIASSDWIGIDLRGAVSDRGRYDAQGRQVGPWQALWPDGHLKHLYPYNDQGELTGIVKRYYQNGQQKTESPYLRGKLNGTANYYNECGTLIDVQTYRDGVLEGPYTTYYPTGQLHYTSTMHAGETDGSEASYYADGSPRYTATSVKGKRQGTSPTYFTDKQLGQSATYEQGQLHGDFKRYFADGTLKEQGRYEHGHRAGLWHEYTMSGKPHIDRNYDAAGELHGDWREYNQQGQPYNVAEYEHGRVRHWQYLDGAGKIQSEGKVGSGRVTMRLLDADGHLKATGDYLNGLRIGEWKYYYFDGQLEQLNHFDEQGRQVGVAEEYYQLGQLMSRTHYDAQGELQGYYEVYFVDGEPKQNGFYRDGKRHGRWHSYFPNGQMSEEYEYHLGQLNGPSRSFAPSGKPTQERSYEFGKLHTWLSYDSTGQVLDRIGLQFDSKEVKLKYVNSNYRVGVACYELSGPAEWQQNDGRPVRRFSHLGSEHEGPSITYWPNGKVRYQRTYHDDQPSGEWLEYYPSGQLSCKKFYNTAGEHGESSYYFPSGQLAFSETHHNGLLDGVMREYNPAGELLVERRYEQGLLRSYRGPGPADAPWLPHTNGRITTTFANGKPAADETFEHGWWGGPSTYYYSSGAVYRRFNHRRTTGYGLRESFLPNGKPLAREYFEHGKLHGRCRYYRPDGTLEREVTYRYDDLNGPLTYFDAAGKPLRTEYYWNTILCGEKPGPAK